MSNGINLFALHYFLWFAAISAIYGYISVYAEHYANATSSQYGLLNMILPFVTIGSKLLFCSLADRQRTHRTYFILFLTTALLGYGSFAVLPFFVRIPPKEAGLDGSVFTIICLMTSVGTISMSVISCLSDAFAVNSAKKYSTSYGMIRLWGTIGWGTSALLLAYVNQINLPFLVPGLIMLIVLIGIDIVFVSCWSNRGDFELDKSASQVGLDDEVETVTSDSGTRLGERRSVSVDTRADYGTNQEHNATRLAGFDRDQGSSAVKYLDSTSVRMQWILFREMAKKRRSIFRYMSLFTISGALISLQWSYFFLYLNQIYSKDFAYISGLSMVGQSMLGELPFFLASQYVVKLLGRAHTLSVSIASLGARYLLYEYLLPNMSMYYVLLTETIQGPSFGLYYVVMTEVGLDYSDCEEAIVKTVEQGLVPNDPQEIEKLRQALRATTQSLMSACYEGLGVGIGSIIGGLIIEHFGFSNLWFYSSLLAMALGVLNSIIEISHLKPLDDQHSRRLEKQLAKRV